MRERDGVREKVVEGMGKRSCEKGGRKMERRGEDRRGESE